MYVMTTVTLKKMTSMSLKLFKSSLLFLLYNKDKRNTKNKSAASSSGHFMVKLQG